jgi:hypothetical protein
LRKRSTLRQHVVLLCPKVTKITTSRDLVDELVEMPRIREVLSHRRNTNETVNAAIKQKFGPFVRSRRWWKQFRKLVIECVVHDLERSLAVSHEECERP